MRDYKKYMSGEIAMGEAVFPEDGSYLYVSGVYTEKLPAETRNLLDSWVWTSNFCVYAQNKREFDKNQLVFPYFRVSWKNKYA